MFERKYLFYFCTGFLGSSAVKNTHANTGNANLITGLGRSPEKETAFHSSILSWEIPSTEKPGGLQFMGLPRVRHDLATKQQLYIQKTFRQFLLGKKSEVTQLCPTLCDPMDCSLPGSSVHGILQARILKWVAISFSRGQS